MTLFDLPAPKKVSEVARMIQEIFLEEPPFQDLWVEGQLADVHVALSGHRYFTLRDEGAQLKGVLFSGEARRMARLLGVLPVLEDGLQVLAHGRLGFYEKGGQVQLYCDMVLPQGGGLLQAELEARKKRLEEEGLFRPERKRPLPPFPKRIGLITSPRGAAVRDMVHIIQRRWPGMEILIVPVKVQGDGAAAEMVAALALANDPSLGLDVLILGRGGGSFEDLSPFQEEELVRAVAMSRLPVVSAVGHETDVTLVDFAADVRAPTPSAAAELVTPLKSHVMNQVETFRERMAHALRRRVERERRHLRLLALNLHPKRQKLRVENDRQQLDDMFAALQRAIRNRVLLGSLKVESLEKRLRTLNPLSVVERGYAVVTREGKVVTRALSLPVGAAVEVTMADGSFRARVEEVRRGRPPAGPER
ncbi:MAG: exodeoxyribonuclease VII large subunit [Bacillota bacterium]|nr:exodeoxyribonuclease VII large subunit [Bacillota bacterium]